MSLTTQDIIKMTVFKQQVKEAKDQKDLEHRMQVFAFLNSNKKGDKTWKNL